MRKFFLAGIVFSIVSALALGSNVRAEEFNTQAEAASLAPLLFYTNGLGSIHALVLNRPVENGALLPVGTGYALVAIPDNGYRLASWSPVNIFTSTTYITNGDGSVSVISNIIPSPEPPVRYGGNLLLKRLQPELIIIDTPLLQITRGQAWQANFVPIGRP